MTNREFKFANSDKVEEMITGFRGVVTGSVYYITGCNQYLITPKAKDSSTAPDSQWYDEDRLKLQTEAPRKITNSKNGPGKMAPIK